jgi:hypothetical protein
MSRGLGTMQRRILETLDEARAAMPRYAGVDWSPVRSRQDGIRYEWIVLGQTRVKLPQGIYDLRCSARYLAEVDGHCFGGHPTLAFTATFSRAVRGLLDRGQLFRLYEIPVAEVDRYGYHRGYGNPRRDLRQQPDGSYTFRWMRREKRFVTLSVSNALLTLRGNQPGGLLDL